MRNQHSENREPQERQEVQQAEQTAENQYAHVFADWDLLPPQMVIRRIRRSEE